MAKQTSVDWLINELGEYFPHEIGGIEMMVNKARQMHREEVEQAYHDGHITGIAEEIENSHELPSNYYNETYGEK